VKESILSACAVYVAQKDKLVAEEKKKVDAAKKEVNDAEKDLQGVKKSVADADKKFQEVCGFEPHLFARASTMDPHFGRFGMLKILNPAQMKAPSPQTRISQLESN